MAVGKNISHKYDLSICMIVKNEEKYIERCLKALMPLKEKIKCELIITDTGSTDNTLNIINKYADQVIKFKWCNDFAKARNTGIEASQGAWVMHVDADEIYEDSISKIADFINSENRDSYDVASIKMNNYAEYDENSEITSSHFVSKLINMTKKKRYFEGEIHENITVNFNKLYYTGTVVQHYGYTLDVLEEKIERNRPALEKQFKKEPNNLRVVNLYVTQERDLSRRIDILEEALNLNHKQIINPENFKVLFVKLAEAYYFRDDRYEQDDKNFLKTVDRYLAMDKEKTKPKLEIYHLAYSFYKKLAYYEDIEYHEKEIYFMLKYIELYEYLDNNPDRANDSLMEFSNSTPLQYSQLSYNASVYYITNQDKNESIKFYQKSEIYKHILGDNFEDSIKNYVALGFELEQYNFLHTMYLWACEFLEEKIELCTSLLNIKYMELVRKTESSPEFIFKFSLEPNSELTPELTQKNNSNQENILKFLKLFSGKSNPFEALNTLRLNNFNIDKCGEEVFNAIIKKSDIYNVNEDDLFSEHNLFSSEILIASIKSKSDKFQFFKNCPESHLEILLYCIHNNHKYFLEEFYMDFIDQRGNETNNGSIPPIVLNCSVAYIYLNEKLKELNTLKMPDPQFDKYKKVFEFYIENMYLSIQKIYSDDIITNKKLKLLTPEYAFSFFVYDNTINESNNSNESNTYIDSKGNKNQGKREYLNIIEEALLYSSKYVNICKIMVLLNKSLNKTE